MQRFFENTGEKSKLRGEARGAARSSMTPEMGLERTSIYQELPAEFLAYVAAHAAADVFKGRCQSGGQKLRSRSSAKANQSQDQCILHHVLTFLATRQLVELYIQLEKHSVHLVFPPQDPRPRRSRSSDSVAIGMPMQRLQLSIDNSAVCHWSSKPRASRCCTRMYTASMAKV